MKVAKIWPEIWILHPQIYIHIIWVIEYHILKWYDYSKIEFFCFDFVRFMR